MSAPRVIVALAAVGLGVAALQLGRAGGSWFWIANMSAPWLLLAFAAGAISGSYIRAALGGLGATGLALVAFYATAGEPLLHVASAQWRYFIGGVVTGPLFGLVGFLWRRGRHRSAIAGALTLAAAFLIEPLAWTLWEGYLPDPWGIWCAEGFCGVLLAVVLIAALRRRQLLPADLYRAD